MTAPEPTLPPERVEELAEALEVAVSEHARDRDAYAATCGSCVRGRREATEFAEALAPLIAGWLAEAEQEGREDNADHGMCYVSGSVALAAREAAAREQGAAEVRAWVEAVCDDAEKHSDTYKRACIVTTGKIRDALATEREEQP